MPKHLGFELELQVVKIVKALAWVPAAERADVVCHLTPSDLRRAVAEQLGLDNDQGSRQPSAIPPRPRT